MSATNDLFTRWKAHMGLESDRAAAARLGVSHGAPNHWRQGRNAGLAVLERMAKDLGEDVVPHYFAALAEAAKDADDKRAAGRIARRLGAACLALIMLFPWMDSSSALASSGSQEGRHGVYIMRNGIAARWGRFVAWLSQMLRLTRVWSPDFFTETSPCRPPHASNQASPLTFAPGSYTASA